MQNIIKKAVFPVAGLGTRFLPATKAIPKELLPIADKPLIQYAVEEAIAAGITELIFITGRTKNAIIDHFDKAYELETELEKRGKHDILKIVNDIIPSNVSCVYLRQPEALGLGHAILCAQQVIAGAPFAVLLADDLIVDEGMGCLAEMIHIYNEEQCSLLAVEEVAPEDVHKYGIVQYKGAASALAAVSGVVEKPKPDEAPSNHAITGRYILTPGIFKKLQAIGPDRGGEIQLTDAIAALLKTERILAWSFNGKRYDCGSKLGYLMANVETGLKHPDVANDFLRYLKQVVDSKH